MVDYSFFTISKIAQVNKPLALRKSKSVIGSSLIFIKLQYFLQRSMMTQQPDTPDYNDIKNNFESPIEVLNRLFIPNMEILTRQFNPELANHEYQSVWLCKICFKFLPSTHCFCTACDDQVGQDPDSPNSWTETEPKIVACLCCGYFLKLKIGQTLRDTNYQSHVLKGKCGVISTFVNKHGILKYKQNHKYNRYQYDAVEIKREGYHLKTLLPENQGISKRLCDPTAELLTKRTRKSSSFASPSNGSPHKKQRTSLPNNGSNSKLRLLAEESRNFMESYIDDFSNPPSIPLLHPTPSAPSAPSAEPTEPLLIDFGIDSDQPNNNEHGAILSDSDDSSNGFEISTVANNNELMHFKSLFNLTTDTTAFLTLCNDQTLTILLKNDSMKELLLKLSKYFTLDLNELNCVATKTLFQIDKDVAKINEFELFLTNMLKDQLLPLKEEFLEECDKYENCLYTHHWQSCPLCMEETNLRMLPVRSFGNAITGKTTELIEQLKSYLLILTGMMDVFHKK